MAGAPLGAVFVEWGLSVDWQHESRSPGKERDSETGLDYFGARYFGSSIGRWLSPDWAAAPTAVPYAMFGDPQSLNLYGYVRNNPSNIFDLNGHCPGEGCKDTNVDVSVEKHASVIQGPVNGTTMTGVGSIATVTFTNKDGSPASGVEVKESPVTTNNIKGTTQPSDQQQPQTKTTDKKGQILDVVMQPVTDLKISPKDAPLVAKVSAKVPVDKTINQTLTFTTTNNGQQSTCTATFSYHLTNVSNGKLNKPGPSGVNFTVTPTQPIVTPQQ